MWCEVELPKVYHFMVKTSGKSKLKNHIHSDDNIINTPSSKKASPATATTTKPTTATLTILATTRTILADDSGARTNVLMQFIVVPIAIVAFFVILGIVWYLKVRSVITVLLFLFLAIKRGKNIRLLFMECISYHTILSGIGRTFYMEI